jgi:uncharacterized protein (TIGR02246 family)
VTSHDHDECLRSFDLAIETYRSTTFERDAQGFNALWADNCTAVFADGEALFGRDEAGAFIEGFFADSDWHQTLDVVRIERRGCRVGVVLFDSIFTPGPDREPKPLAIGVTFVREDGDWLVVHNHDSTGPVRHEPSPLP